MRKGVLTLIGIVCAAVVFANGQYEKAMAKNVPALFRAADAESLLSVINQLNRIGDAEGDQWEPYYYSAFGYIRMMSMASSVEEKDGYLDNALEAISKGEEIKPNDSELESMRGYVHMMRLTVDPASRGQQYSGMAFGSFQKAIKLNPENGRAHFLLGRMQQGTAQFMGGGDGGACETFGTAQKLLESEKREENSFAPTWGLNQVNEAIAQLCKG